MSAKVQVKTRPRTMSGRRGGLVLSLDRVEAEDWIRRGWADRVEPDAVFMPDRGIAPDAGPERRAKVQGRARRSEEP